MFDIISDQQMETVAGGQTAASTPAYDPNNNALGRVGPGTGMSWLGNYYTPEAYEHDRRVRDAKAGGATTFQAHMGALPQLPAAAMSWFRAKFNPGPQDRRM